MQLVDRITKFGILPLNFKFSQNSKTPDFYFNNSQNLNFPSIGLF
jgi:hypothetical protein